MGETTGLSIPEVIKSYPILAAAASLLYAGLGQVLCGKIRRGILILAFSSLITISYYVIERLLYLLYPTQYQPIQWLSYLLYSVSMAIPLFIRIWAVYDASRIASDLKTVKERSFSCFSYS